MTIWKILNLLLTKDAPTYMECIFEEKLKIIQEMVDREQPAPELPSLLIYHFL